MFLNIFKLAGDRIALQAYSCTKTNNRRPKAEVSTIRLVIHELSR